MFSDTHTSNALSTHQDATDYHLECSNAQINLHIYTQEYFVQESPLPLTDPHNAEAQRMLHIPYRIIW